MEVGESDASGDVRPACLLKGLTPHMQLGNGERFRDITKRVFHLGPPHLGGHSVVFVKERTCSDAVEAAPVAESCTVCNQANVSMFPPFL